MDAKELLSYSLLPENPKLPPEDKALWLAALRDGSHAQSTGALRTTTGFCCLGVYCDVKGAKWLERGDHFTTESGAGWFLGWQEIGHDATAALQAETTYRDIDDSPVNVMKLLSAANDQGASFAQIADWIEKNL